MPISKAKTDSRFKHVQVGQLLQSGEMTRTAIAKACGVDLASVNLIERIQTKNRKVRAFWGRRDPDDAPKF